MKLGKSAIASVDEITEATLVQMVQDGDIPEDWMGYILQAFKQVSCKGDTDLIMLLSIACAMVLEKESFEYLKEAINSRAVCFSEQNTFNYYVLNKVDESLKS